MWRNAIPIVGSKIFRPPLDCFALLFACVKVRDKTVARPIVCTLNPHLSRTGSLRFLFHPWGRGVFLHPFSFAKIMLLAYCWLLLFSPFWSDRFASIHPRFGAGVEKITVKRMAKSQWSEVRRVANRTDGRLDSVCAATPQYRSPGWALKGRFESKLAGQRCKNRGCSRSFTI